MTDDAQSKKSWSPAQIATSAIVGIFLWSALGFSWFGFGFGWNTASGAAQASATAVVDELATICVAQAKSATDSMSSLAKLSELSQWKQGEFVKKAGWATMHGSESSNGRVAERCATQLVAEAEKAEK